MANERQAADASNLDETHGGAGTALLGRPARAVVVNRELLDAAVSEVNRRFIVKGLETMQAIGEYLLDTFFEGDPANFHAHRGDFATFRELAERDDLAPSASYLWRCVSVTEQLRALPGEVALALPPTHHALLLPVKDEKVKAALAARAAGEHWTKGRMAEEVRAATTRLPGAPRTGRRRVPGFVKTVRGWGRLLSAPQAGLADIDGDQLTEGEAGELLATLREVEAACARVRAALGQSGAAPPESSRGKGAGETDDDTSADR